MKPEYCSTLFQIYAQSNNDLHKVTALICLKNMVQSIFSGFRRGFKKDCPLSPDGIIELKQSVFKALANEFTLSYREKLNEMAVSISCTAFPTHFSEALEFSHYIVKQLADDLKRGALSLSQQTFQLLDTVRKICKTAARRRSQASPEYHKQVVESIFPSILEVWSHYYERLVLGQAGLMELQICSCIDAILIFVLRMGTPASIHGNPALVEVIKRLIQKSEAMMKVYSKIGRELETGYDSDLYLIWEKTAITLTYELAYVHNLSPMAFLPFLDDYLKYVVQLTLGSWPNITVKKSCLLMFYRSLKLRVQYSSNSLYFNQYSKDMQDLAKSKEQTYGQVISRETLEQLFSELLSKTMTVEEEGRENKLEVLLTDEEPDGIDQTNDELDCALRKIALSLIEQLVTTFSEESLDLIHKLTERMVTDQLAADIKTKDSIVSVVGLLPHLYLKTGVAKSSWMNIEPVLKWMASKGKEFIFFSRRYPMLVRMWTDIIDSETIRTFVGPLCELMASNDIVTKYSCISALKKIIKLEKEDKLPLMDILACVVPAILYICDNLNNPQLIWPVISILTNIMDKSKLSAQNQTVEMLEKINMDKLLEKNDKLIRSALIDMFKTIIVAAPFGTPLPAIFEVSLRFLTLALPKIEQYDTEELAFWHFFSKEITSVPEHAKVIAKHFAFANTMIPVASQKMDDSMQLDFLASVVDECLLLDSQQINFEYAFLT